MNTYVTGNTIRNLREERKMTQAELADRICVSSKTVSKWETAKGLPDISLLQLRGRGIRYWYCNRHGPVPEKATLNLHPPAKMHPALSGHPLFPMV